MRKYAVELIGTFFLLFTIGMTTIDPGGASPGLAPLAIGSALMVMVFAGGHISGAHYNPAVTLAVWIRGRCDAKDIAPYLAAQVIGAVLAALLVMYLKAGPKVEVGKPDMLKWLIAELVFTYALVYVVLNVATARGTTGNSFYGLAIGFTVLVGAYAVGPISGGAFNPAVAIGLCTLGKLAWIDLWIFLVGNFAGAVLAAYTFKYLNPDDV